MAEWDATTAWAFKVRLKQTRVKLSKVLNIWEVIGVPGVIASWDRTPLLVGGYKKIDTSNEQQKATWLVPLESETVVGN